MSQSEWKPEITHLLTKEGSIKNEFEIQKQV